MTATITTLDNGLRVASVSMPFLETVSVSCWVDVGSRYETIAQSGATHMLEHMVFKGTRARTARQIAEDIEVVGGHLNAYTSRDQTTFYARVLKEDTPLAVGLLADILQNALLDPEEISRERDVILQELGQTHDTPDDIIFDFLQEAAFPDQAIGRSILGTEESVEGMTADRLRSYHSRHYRPGATVIAAAGRVDHDALVDEVAAQFTNLPKGEPSDFERAQYRGGHVYDVRPLEQVHLAIAFPAVSFHDPKFYAVQILATMLGGGMSSRLFQEVREERGLAYSVYAFAGAHQDTGLFTIYAGTSPQKADEALRVIAGEVQAVSRIGDEDELARAKAQLKAGLFMALESSTAQAEQLGRQLLIFGRPISTSEIVEEIDRLTLADIATTAEQLLCSQKPTFAAVGPVEKVMDYETLSSVFQGTTCD
ncbi:MAG: pitrilysin family protein [Pseudomonadota bacterium]